MIKVHGVKLLSVNKNGTRTAKIGISLSSSENKTVNAVSVGSLFTLSASSLTFTTSNWYIPQTLTITGVNDANIDYCLYDTLRLSASGDSNVDIKVAIVDTNDLFTSLNGFRWTDENKINSLSDVTTKRAWLIDKVFNGNGLPTNAVPTATTIGYTGQMHSINTSDLTHSSSVNKETFTYTDVDGYVWTYYAYRIITNQTSVNKIVFIDGGHTIDGGVETQDQVAINLFNASGIDCMYVAMPIAGENTENNPNISTASITITTRHNQIIEKRLDRSGFNGIALFVGGTMQVVNWIVANLPTYEIIVATLSGGGIHGRYLGALTDSISQTYILRGYGFRANYPTTLTLTDYEGGGTRSSYWRCGLRVWEVVQIFEGVDFALMCASNGRKFVCMLNTNDVALIAAEIKYSYVQRDWFVTLGSKVNGNIGFYSSNNAADSAHQYHTDDVNYVISQL